MSPGEYLNSLPLPKISPEEQYAIVGRNDQHNPGWRERLLAEAKD